MEWTSRRVSGGGFSRFQGGSKSSIEKLPGPETASQISSFVKNKPRYESNLRGTNFAGIANSSILNPRDRRDRFEDNKKIHSPELKTDNYGKHSPSIIYNTID